MAKIKELSAEDLEYIQNNTHKSASELSRVLNKPRPKIAKKLKEFLGTELGNNKTTLSQEEQQFILENYKTMTTSEMEEQLGCVDIKAKVTRFLRSKGIKRHTGIKAFNGNEEYAKSYIKEYHESKSIQELADDLNTTYKVISHWKNKLGLEPYACVKTSIEYFVENLLKLNNIQYISQYKILKYRYDYFLPNFNLVIEVHGDYWHANPVVYGNKKLNNIQKSCVENDAVKSELLLDKNISLLIFWEYDIKNNPKTLVQILKDKLNMPVIEEIL